MIKKLLLILLVVFTSNQSLLSQEKNKKSSIINSADFTVFGEKFEASKVLSNKEMLKKYKAMKKGDSLSVKFKSNIKEVCKKKGCWMQMDLTSDKQAFVRFLDYGFFVPLNADNSEAIVNGVAYIDIVTVDELKHYAKDGGKSQAEINKIKKPEITYAFRASGVLIKK
jgi:hypothetical protein